jgi:hypothetical protein
MLQWEPKMELKNHSSIKSFLLLNKNINIHIQNGKHFFFYNESTKGSYDRVVG